MKPYIFAIVFLCALAVVAADEYITCNETDGGRDYFTQGTITGSHFGNGQYWTWNYTDYCTDNGHRLVETWCDNTYNPVESNKEEVVCENGCENGACQPPKIPEFELGAGVIALIGAIAGFFILRKK